MLFDLIPLCYHWTKTATTHAEIYRKSLAALSEAQAEAESLRRTVMLPAVKAKAEAEQQKTINRLKRSADIAADLCKAYIFRAMRAATQWKGSDQPAERYAAAVTYMKIADICVSHNIQRPAGLPANPPKPDTADEVEAMKITVKCIRVSLFSDDSIELEEEATHTAALTEIAQGICPYNFDAAMRLEDIIIDYLGNVNITEATGKLTIECETSPTSSAGEPLSNALVGCRAADMLIRHQLTGDQQAIILEVLARAPRPKKDVKEIKVSTPDIIVPLTEQDVSTITQAVYGRNKADRRDRLYSELQNMALTVEYDYMDAEGNVVHRKGQLLHAVVDTYKETGAFKGMAVHLCPAFGLLVKSKYWPAYLQEYHRQRIAANGDEFSSLYMAVMAHFDAIQQAAAHGKRMKVEVSFAQVFGPRPDKAVDINAYHRYIRRINRAEAVAQTVAQVVGATSFEAKKHAGERIGIAFDFTPPEVEVTELAARVKIIEDKMKPQPTPKRGRGRPRKA